MKYFSIFNSDVSLTTRTPDEQINNIDGEKPKDKESGLKNSSYGRIDDARITSKGFKYFQK